MLITSPRHSPADLLHWSRLERYDARLAASSRASELTGKAIAEMGDFMAAGDCCVSVSWGKDSVVVAHIAATLNPRIRVEWVRSKHFETPECEEVRDAFLELHPGVDYREHLVTLTNPKRGEPGYEQHHTNPHAKHQDVLKDTIRGRWISGLRAEESAMRRMSMRHRGLSTARTCRPLAWWDATDIFAHLHLAGLPVHPVYGMTFGGRLDRRWLRVHPLCSHPPKQSAVHGWDMAGWEDHYYADVITAALDARRTE